MGMKLQPVNLNAEALVPCTFKTTALNKHKLIKEAKARGVTLSEVLSDIVSFYNANEDLREQFSTKLQAFILEISDGNNDKITKYTRIWRSI